MKHIEANILLLLIHALQVALVAWLAYSYFAQTAHFCDHAQTNEQLHGQINRSTHCAPCNNLPILTLLKYTCQYRMSKSVQNANLVLVV